MGTGSVGRAGHGTTGWQVDRVSEIAATVARELSVELLREILDGSS